MKRWNGAYLQDLSSRCDTVAKELDGRIDDIVAGRVAPAVEDLAIGSAKRMGAAVLFFDLRGFSQWSGSPWDAGLKRALSMLDIVIPMMMHVLHDNDAYVEKNTGDGVMAVFPDAPDAASSVKQALTASAMMFYVLDNLVGPALVMRGLLPVHARIGIDYGPLLLARIGVASGTARQNRNSLVAVGPAAIIASRLQGLAGTDETWVGDAVRLHAPPAWRSFFKARVPEDWPWYAANALTQRYWVWQFAAEMVNPYTLT